MSGVSAMDNELRRRVHEVTKEFPCPVGSDEVEHGMCEECMCWKQYLVNVATSPPILIAGRSAHTRTWEYIKAAAIFAPEFHEARAASILCAAVADLIDQAVRDQEKELLERYKSREARLWERIDNLQRRLDAKEGVEGNN